jgi:tetratricopeptide (TPR) repeat protein
MKRRNLYILITIVITSYLQLACAEQATTENVVPAASAEQIAEARVSAEKLFEQRRDAAKLREAVELIAKVRDPNKRDFDVEWSYARYNYFLGRRSGDDAESEKAFTAGKDAAKIALNLKPDRPEGHFWYAANLGELCKRSPVTVGLRNVGEVRDEMNKVIQIDPGFQGATAYDVLAQIELATRIKDGSAEKAVEYLEKAIALEKENSNLHLHLAEAYLILNKDAEAKKQLDQVLRMKPSAEYLPEHMDAVEEAKKLLAKKFR